MSRKRPLDCPICAKPLDENAAVDSPVFPFCSVRCKQVDLLRWFDGKYEVVESLDPSRMLEEDEEERPFSTN